ncbi:M23 family metallopeptidase [Nocardioides sediminis]|uniref:M23 family metallopeptidase n=1 Tax=Nocardioides sediminis TaxID=433648 RepID=UPI001F255473|nr:M23 family metallopeptidase [Nocardioides sediminis]
MPLTQTLLALAVLASAVLAPVVLAPVIPASAVPAPAAAQPDDTPQGEWPLDPRPEVEAAFDPPDDPWGAGHRGVDLAGRIGQPVRSALPGEVRFAGRIAGKPVVTVAHGDTRTTYEPVVATVEVGTRVSAGGVIGALDLPGSHCFPRACLHWGWLRGDTYLDPLDLVGGGPVRLLPLWRDEPVAAGGWRPPVHPYAAWLPPLPAPPVPAPVVSAPPSAGGRPVGSLP